MYIVSFALGDMNYLLKFVACSMLVDNLIEYFEPTGAINTITMNEKNNLNRKLFWLTKWLSKVLQIKLELQSCSNVYKEICTAKH